MQVTPNNGFSSNGGSPGGADDFAAQVAGFQQSAADSDVPAPAPAWNGNASPAAQDGVSQTGPLVTRSYAASGALLATTTTQADGSRTVLVEGASSGQTWTSALSFYDAAGRMTEQQVSYADQHVDDMILDVASGLVTSSTSRNASGQITQQSLQQPDGSGTQTRYDAAGVVDEVTTRNADGTSTRLQTNTASHPFGTAAWYQVQDTFNAAGTMTDEFVEQADFMSTTSHYDLAHKGATQLETIRQTDGTSEDMVFDTSGAQTYTSYDVYRDAAGHIAAQYIANRDGTTEKVDYTASGAVASSTTLHTDKTISVVTDNPDGSFTTADYTAAGLLSDTVVVRSATSFTRTEFQIVNGKSLAERSFQFNSDGSWVQNDYDDALAGSPLLVQLVHNADGTETDYVHAPQGGQSYTSYTVQKDRSGTVTEEDIQGADGSYTQDIYSAGKLAKSTRDVRDGTYSITYLNTGSQPWVFQVYDYNAKGQYTSAETYYQPTGQAAYWTQDTWTGPTETWTGKSTHYDNGSEYDVVIGGASDNFNFYTVSKSAAGAVTQQTIVNADGSTTQINSDASGHVYNRVILQADGGWDQEVVNAAGQTGAIAAHGADGSGVVQTFAAMAGGVMTMTSQALYDTSGTETSLARMNADGSRSEATLDAAGHVRQVSILKPDDNGVLTLASQANYDTSGTEISVLTVNADGSRKLAEFDAQGQVRKVSLERADGSVGASFVLEAGDGVTAGAALLNGVAFSLAEEIEAQPADDKHTVSKKVTLPDHELYNVTMDASGKIVYEHVHTGDGILGFVEQAVGIVLNVLAFVPGVNAVAAPLAVAWDLAQSGKDFANGNYLGGVLNLASAVGVGAVGAGALADTGGIEGDVASGLLSDAGISASSATAFGQGVLEAAGVAGGTSGILASAKDGDVLGIVTGAFTVVASGAAAAVTGGVLGAPAGSDAAALANATAAENVATTISVGAGITSTFAGAADGFAHGNAGAGLLAGLGFLVSQGSGLLGEANGTVGGHEDGGTGGAAVVDVKQEELPPLPSATGDAGTGGVVGDEVLTGTAADLASHQDAAVRVGQASAPDAWVGTRIADRTGLLATADSRAGGATGMPGGEAPGGSGPAGVDGSGSDGTLATDGVTTDAAGTVHVDVEPVGKVYAPAGDAAAAAASPGTMSGPGLSENFEGVTVRLGSIGPAGDGSGATTGTASDGSGLMLAGTSLPRIVTGETPAQVSMPVAGEGGSGGADGGGTGLTAPALTSQTNGPPAASSGATAAAGLPLTAVGVAGSMVAAGAGSGSGLGSTAAGGAVAGSGGGGAFLSGATEVGLDVLGSVVAAPVAFVATLLAPSPLHDDTLNALLPPSDGASLGGSGAGSSVSGQTSSGVSVNTGNQSTMTGLGASTTLVNPGFAQAPPLTSLPGFAPTSDGGQGTIGGTETLPIDTATSKVTVVSTPAVNSSPTVFSGSGEGDGLQGVQIVEAAGMGRMTLPRTDGLGDVASMADLVATGALPSRQGVILTDPASNPAAVFGGMYDLSQQTGAEYALTKEDGQLVLYSGAPNSVSVPSAAEPVAHTHPDGTEPLPSIQDIQLLNRIWIDNPTGPRPSSTIIWGLNPDNVTNYSATGFDQLTGLK